MDLSGGFDPAALAEELGVDPDTVGPSRPNSTGAKRSGTAEVPDDQREQAEDIIVPAFLPPWLVDVVCEDSAEDRSEQSWHLVSLCAELGVDDGTAGKLLALHRPTLAKYGDRDEALTDLAGMAKARQGHRHVGKQCTAVGCTNAPRWMRDGDEATTERVPDTDADDDEEAPSSWEPVDLRPALDGEDVPPPVVLARTDGRCLLYAGKVHWFQGESESCKTWAALAAVAQVLDDGGRVLVVDFEDDERTFVARLRELGVDPVPVLDRITYVRPEEPLSDRKGRVTKGAAALARVLDGDPYNLCVIDGVTEAYTVEGLDLLDNGDTAKWMRLLPKRIASTGAAVVCIDHVVKNAENRGRYALGAAHKLAGVTGAVFAFKTLRPLARADGAEPVVGIVTMTVEKDRPGHVRSLAMGTTVATVELTSWPEAGLTVALGPPNAAPPADLGLCHRILEHVAKYDGCSQRNILDNIGGNADAVRAALRWMVDDERAWLRIEPKGRSHLHWLTDAGREAL